MERKLLLVPVCGTQISPGIEHGPLKSFTYFIVILTRKANISRATNMYFCVLWNILSQLFYNYHYELKSLQTLLYEVLRYGNMWRTGGIAPHVPNLRTG